MNLPLAPAHGAAISNSSSSATDGSHSMPALMGSATTSAWSAQMSTFPANNGALAGASFQHFSASTAAILQRLQGKNGHASGSAAFEAKRAEILQNYVTSDKLPAPPPIANSARKARGGRTGTPSMPKAEAGAGPAPTTSSARRSSRARGRGRGRRAGKGSKRKRSESDEESGDSDDSDFSSSYTPLPTRTKSGRSVNKPVVFVPTLPASLQGTKRRKSTKTLLAAKCKTCHRETEPSNNRIVFCDACSTAYHQYCHNPPIDNEVVTVPEKEWLCGPCVRTQQSVVHGLPTLTAAEDLTIDEKRAYFSTLSAQHLTALLLTAVVRHPELPVFPANVRDLLPNPIASASQQIPPVGQGYPQPSPYVPSKFHPPITSPPSGPTPPTPNFSSHMGADPAETQLVGEIRPHVLQPNIPSCTTIDLTVNQYEEDDGYDTDPPAHYPRPGNGLARAMRPESEDLTWLVDDNFGVFSHGWKGDGTGIGADGTLDVLGKAA